MIQPIKNIVKAEIPTILAVFLLVVILSVLSGCATSGRKGSSIIPGREATEIWHSYEILPNYHYYTSGPQSQPNFIIGIDDKYQFTSKLWKPVDLTPEMLKNWFNYINPRVGYSENTYGAFILGPNGERLGLWYSVRDWRTVGSASVTENNQVSVTAPGQRLPGGGAKRYSIDG
jgi:hypothetical protein